MCAEEAARGGAGAAARRRGHGTAAEVVASPDVTVPTAGRTSRTIKCTHCWLSNQGRRTLPQHFVCAFSVLFSILLSVWGEQNYFFSIFIFYA